MTGAHTTRDRAVAVAVAVALTVVFWGGLWAGGGLIGGDLYSYFFPQKVFYAEQLAEGRVPLWNDRVGFGYPVLGESQTGALYPPNLVAYRLLPVNAAYSATQIGHYVAGFLAMLAWLRGCGLGRAAALLGAGVYAYSWFPPRICLEWAAVGMPYLPLGLWLIDRRAWGWLGVALGMHLLAGHYNLAFIECVAWTVYVFGRGSAPQRDAGAEPLPQVLAAFALAMLLGFSLASVQLLDTAALKAASQREGEAAAFSPGYGHVPPLYLLQMAAGWLWYGPGLDAAIQAMTPAVAADTNKVEAHLYVGLAPLLLAGWRLVQMVRGGGDRRSWTLVGLAAFAAVYATGVLVPVAKYLPGFGYFMGPGRWGIVVTLALAYLAARGLDALAATPGVPAGGASRQLKAMPGRHSRSLAVAAFGLTLAELWLVSGLVTYAWVRPWAPVDDLDRSPVKQYFDQMPRPTGPPRVYAPGENVVTMLGVAQWPTYLGLGPAAYWTAMPERPEGAEGMFYSDAQAAWLRENAVGYALSFEPLDAGRWGLTPLWRGVDPVLNGIWGRGGEPLFLYEIEGAAESAFAAEGHCDPTDASLTNVDWRPGRVSATTEANAFQVRQARLAYGLLHGWVANSRVSCRGNPFAVGESTNAPGRKTIRYRPGYWFVSLPLTLAATLATVWRIVRTRRSRPAK